MQYLSHLRHALLALFVAHELPTLFSLILIEEMGVPLPLPGDTLIAFSGGRGHHSFAHALVVIGTVALAAALGSTLLYLIARRGGPALVARLERIPVLHLDPARVARMQAWFRERGPVAIVLGRLVPGLRTPTTVMAGVAGVPYRVFAPSTAVAAIIWSAFYYYAGAALAPLWTPVRRWAGAEPDQVIALAVFLLAIGGLWWWLRRPSAPRVSFRPLARRIERWIAMPQTRRTLQVLVATPLTALCAVSLSSLTSFAYLGHEVGEAETLPADQHLLRAIDSRAVHLPLSLPINASLLGAEVTVGGLALLLCAWFLWKRRALDAAFVALAIGGSAALTYTLKLVYERTRPTDFFRVPESGYSFPSGHVLSATCLALALGALLWRGGAAWPVKAAVSVALAAAVAVVALSRLALGVHYPTDVLGSTLIGVAWLTALIAARGVLERRGDQRYRVPSPV